MSLAELFQRIISALDLAGIAYMVSGSFASAHYGASRSTQDIDIVIAATPVQLRALVQNLRSDEYYVDLDAALEALTRQSLFKRDRSDYRLEDRFHHPQIPPFQPGRIQAPPQDELARSSNLCR